MLSGLLGVAVRHSAIPTNPVGDLSRIHTCRRKATRSLTLAGCRAWLAQLDTDEDADKDLPDLCRFMIGTGVQIGEARRGSWSRCCAGAPDGDVLGPVFPDTLGGWRDPSNTRRALRDARGSEGFAWVTSHVFRRTCATILDQSGQSSRSIADQLGHAQVSMTQKHYRGRRIANPAAAAALDVWHDQEDENHG